MKIDVLSYISNKQVDPVILAMLKKLGLTSTGNQQLDIQNIKKVVQEQGQQTGGVNSFSEIDQINKASTQVAALLNGEPAWISLMQELGLQPTGSKEGDMTAISQKINALESRAVTKEELEKVADYKTQFSSYFGVPVGGTKSVDDLAATQQVNPTAGIEQLAELNKHFLVKHIEI